MKNTTITVNVSVYSEGMEVWKLNTPHFVLAGCESVFADRLQKAYNLMHLDDMKSSLASLKKVISYDIADIEDITPDEVTDSMISDYINNLDNEDENKKLYNDLQNEISLYSDKVVDGAFIPNICRYLVRTLKYSRQPVELSEEESLKFAKLYKQCKIYYEEGYSQGIKSDNAEKYIRTIYCDIINTFLEKYTYTQEVVKDGKKDFESLPYFKTLHKVPAGIMTDTMHAIFPVAKGAKSKVRKGDITASGFKKNFPKETVFYDAIMREYFRWQGIIIASK